ncbi:hypothetical protein ACPCSC_21120 [Streptomyces lavendulocolor]|uniref:hypothetical protein n=1 Tax=Streptomyces lavendulocolor TaxID=67316 RepID=UPI003C2CCB8A
MGEDLARTRLPEQGATATATATGARTATRTEPGTEHGAVLLRIAGMPLAARASAGDPALLARVARHADAAGRLTARARDLAERLGADVVPHPDLPGPDRGPVLALRRRLHAGHPPGARELALLERLSGRAVPPGLAAGRPPPRHGRTAPVRGLARARRPRLRLHTAPRPPGRPHRPRPRRRGRRAAGRPRCPARRRRPAALAARLRARLLGRLPDALAGPWPGGLLTGAPGALSALLTAGGAPRDWLPCLGLP